MSDDPTSRILAAIEALGTRLTAVEARLEQVSDRLNKTRADVMERINRLQNSVDAIREDIAVNFGAA